MASDMSAASPGEMTFLELGQLIDIADDSTVSRTVLKADGARLVLFSFDTGQELSEHSAAMPVLIHVVDGRLTVGAGGESVELGPGGIIHLPARLPHSVLAVEPTRMLLTMLDPRSHS